MKIFLILLLFLLPLSVFSSDNKTINLNDGDVLENVALGKDSNIIVGGNANVTIKDCVIDTDKKIAIEAKEGNGTLNLVNCRISSRTGKGLYIQPGRVINISNCVISNCKEEGLDLRSETKGMIENNSFDNNGESGIELIAGSSDLEIENNEFENNGASGIAIQFYSFAEDEGKINLAGNSFKNNRKYGIDCSIPQGIKPPAYYWNESISLTNNKFFQNTSGTVEKECNYTGPVDEEDEKILEKVAVEFDTANVGYEEEGIMESIWRYMTGMWDKLRKML